MAEKTTPPAKASPVQSRDDRLKAALKANMARRKAQARARAATNAGAKTEDSGKNEG
jgi:hypothetical protein